MQLVNETTYDTRLLRKLLGQVYRRLTRKLGKLRQWRRVTVIVRYSRGASHYSGLADLGGTQVLLRIPRQGARSRLVAYLAEHEFRHLYGQDHHERVFQWRWPTSFKPWAWAAEVIGITVLKRKRALI